MIDHETHSGASPIYVECAHTKLRSADTRSTGHLNTERGAIGESVTICYTISSLNIADNCSILIWLHLVVPASVVVILYPFGEVWVIAVRSAAAHVTTTVVATASIVACVRVAVVTGAVATTIAFVVSARALSLLGVRVGCGRVVYRCGGIA